MPDLSAQEIADLTRALAAAQVAAERDGQHDMAARYGALWERIARLAAAPPASQPQG